MRKRGYLSSRTTKPYKPIYDRLLRREQLVGDVFRTGPGRWNLAEWYTLEEAARLKQQHVKANEEHIERTKRGIEEAKLRGRRIGAPLIVTGEVKAQILRLLAEGKGVYEIASSLNLTPQAIYRHLTKADGTYRKYRPRAQ